MEPRSGGFRAAEAVTLGLSVALWALGCGQSRKSEPMAPETPSSFPPPGGSTGSPPGSRPAPEGMCATDTDCPGPHGACGAARCYHGQCGLDNLPMHAPCNEAGGKTCDGAGVCVECVRGADCADGICEGHRCLGPTCADQVKNGAETDVDCGGPSCDPCGAGRSCATGVDCKGGACDAKLATCSPTCSDESKSPSLGETDVDCGGPSCLPCAVGRACLAAADCQSELCEGGRCKPQLTCSDGVQGGGETGVDCGGPSCAPCAAGGGCDAPRDCESSVCLSSVCAAAACDDGVKNGGESSVDCGAVCPARCPPGVACLTGGDCESFVCSSTPDGGRCATTACDDGVKNGSETDKDCGGGCPAKCPPFHGCLVNADCVSGACNPGTQICEPSCTDGIQDGAETDIDCGGPCPKPCPVLWHCTRDEDCVSFNCIFGHCYP